MPPTTPKLRELRNRPLCIICARAAEAEEIAKALKIENNRISGHEVQKVNNGYTFYLGSFRLNSDENLEYYVTSGLRQGIQSFTINASVLFSILHPRFVIHAGVCAGYYDPTGKLKMNIADVIFGEAATNYQEGKAEYIDGQVFFRPDYKQVEYSAGNMQAFAESASRPKYHYGEYISGASVRTDASIIFRKIRSDVNRNVIALDMEASAFLQLCRHFEGDQAISLGVIKGVSDFGDPAKGTVENAYNDALKNTAHALEQWVTYRITSITWTKDESDEPAAKIVPGYYENFVRRVLDNYLQGWPVRDKTDPRTVIPNQEIKGFKTVLPQDCDPGFAQEFGHVQNLVQRHHIREVDIGGSTAGRYLYYKAGYLIDWARTVNSLKICEDGKYQVEVFGRLLSKNPYYIGSDNSPAQAFVVSWEDTVQWLKDVEQEEAEQGKMADISVAEKAIKENNGKEEDKMQSIREGRQPMRNNSPARPVFSESRHESPKPLRNTDPSSHRDAIAQNNTVVPPQSMGIGSILRGDGKSLTSNPAGSKETKDKQRSSTNPPKRSASKEARGNKRSTTLSSRQSLTRLFHAFRKHHGSDQPNHDTPPVPGK
ncbi:purine and uridine phosphorylase [Lojkania enalia]|uniref:Purine and uridine phosphorylase n=1 Tax=Lojkania enalia TaxID=147567 RepID=A0A9P4TNN7_9PLEO|nr:purine and uridine phosphorylase [Didymosphaeria enalia]